jgi:signal transduction histidine kinase
LSPAQQEFANLAHRNLARLKDRIEDALDIAGPNSGKSAEWSAVRLEELAGCVARRAAVESAAEPRIRFEGFSGEQRLAIQERSLCRTLASIVGTVSRHLGQGRVRVRATVEKGRIRFEIGADGPSSEGRENAVIHDASVALARKMVEIHGGSLSELETGCCGIYVLLPLRPICAQEER